MIDTLEMSAQEMVEWANANLERVAALENEIERLTADVLHWKGMTKGRESEIDKHLAEIKRLRAALEMIAYGLPDPQSLAKCRNIAREALKDDTTDR